MKSNTQTLLTYNAANETPEEAAHNYVFGNLSVSEYIAKNCEGQSLYQVLDEIERIKRTILNIITYCSETTECTIWFAPKDRLFIERVISKQVTIEEEYQYWLKLQNK
jgi:hypothetical protein